MAFMSVSCFHLFIGSFSGYLRPDFHSIIQCIRQVTNCKLADTLLWNIGGNTLGETLVVGIVLHVYTYSISPCGTTWRTNGESHTHWRNWGIWWGIERYTDGERDGERCGKCNEEYWITPVLNLAQSSVSAAEREREGKKGRRVGEGMKEGGKAVQVISAELSFTGQEGNQEGEVERGNGGESVGRMGFWQHNSVAAMLEVLLSWAA